MGDGSVGKTCMLISYTSDRFPTEYVPTIFENYSTKVNVDNQKLSLSLWDTGGQDHYDELHKLNYLQAPHVFIIVFSVIEPSSLENALNKWLPELNYKNQKAPIIAGNKIDLRDE